MKKIISQTSIYLFAVVLLRSEAFAALVLNETFSYPDGPLTSVAGTVWSTHSGTTGEVNIVSGKVSLTQSKSEDVSATLADGPYNGATLYASFIVNYSGLPTRNGTFFAHFGTSSFRSRVFATTNGAATGHYRLGIANAVTATPATIVARDLDTNADYFVVIRYKTGTAESTLWITPDSEGATADRVDATDSASAIAISKFALRQAVSSGDGMGTLVLDDLKVGTAFSDVVEGLDPTKNPPSISRVPDQDIAANTATTPISLTVGDNETPAASLTLSGSSSNPAVVPDAGITFGGSDSNRTVTITPAAFQQGSALVTVAVTDADQNTASTRFLVVVGAPGILPIGDRILPVNGGTLAVPFTLIDPEFDSLQVSAVSTNTALLPESAITFSGTGLERTMMLTPLAGISGLTWITLFVTDGFNTASNSFVLTVFPETGIEFADAFDYPDGSITTNSLFTWKTHSAGLGQTGQTQVAQGKLLLTGAQGEDISVILPHAPFVPEEGWILYTRLMLNFSLRPTSGAGQYFAHFRNAGNSFGSRLFAVTNGAAAGTLRVGVANNAGAPSAILPVDLETNRDYVIITSFNVGVGQTTLWVDPATEDDLNVTATDAPSLFDVSSYAFRQSAGMGAFAVEDLKIGTSFSDVASIALPRLEIAQNGSAIEISWPAETAEFVLQSSSAIGDAASWANVNQQATMVADRYVLSVSGSTGNLFFRLTRLP
jgi:hypothetical protein